MKKENTNEWRAKIIKHYSKPIHKKNNIDKEYVKIQQFSNSCVDNFEIGFIETKSIINDIIFNGEGCAISVSSIDIMIEEIINLEIKLAVDKINNFLDMLNGKEHKIDSLGNLVVFSKVNMQPNRIKCASIGILGILKLLTRNENNG